MIQKATTAQREKIIELLLAQLREHSISTPLEKITSAVDGIFSNPNLGALHVAILNENIIGVSCLSFIWTIEHGGKAAWLEEIYIMPSHRTSGIGTKLLEATMEFAKSLNCSALDLEVEDDHARVKKWYERHGFSAHTRSRFVKRFKL